MEILAYLLIIAGIALMGVWFFIYRQGDANFTFLVDQRTKFKVEELNNERAVFSTVIPFVNNGTQDGTLMDVYPRHLLPSEYYRKVKVSSRITLSSNRRDDDYWEALIVFKTQGDSIILNVTLEAENHDMRAALAEYLELGIDVPIDITYQVVARSDWYISKTRLVMHAEELTEALNSYRLESEGAN